MNPKEIEAKIQALAKQVQHLTSTHFGSHPMVHPTTIKNLKQYTGGAALNASGPGTNETVAASFTPKNIPIASATFTNGVTYGTTAGGNLGFTILTAGQYLVIGQVFYGNPVVINKSYQSMVYVNGSEVFAAYNVPPAAGISVAVPAVKIISLSVGDYVELWAQTGSTGNETVTGSLSYLSLAQV